MKLSVSNMYQNEQLIHKEPFVNYLWEGQPHVFLGFHRSVFCPTISLKNYLKELFTKLSPGKKVCNSSAFLGSYHFKGDGHFNVLRMS